MAKITHNELAPSEKVHYSFSGVEFDLDGRTKTFETDDAVVITNARSHPWLSVEMPKAEMVSGQWHEQIAPEDDPLSAASGSKANDPEAARAAEAEKDGQYRPVAIESGLKQTKAVSVDQVSQTVAAETKTEKDADK